MNYDTLTDEEKEWYELLKKMVGRIEEVAECRAKCGVCNGRKGGSSSCSAIHLFMDDFNDLIVFEDGRIVKRIYCVERIKVLNEYL